MISLACQLDYFCPVAVWESLHTTIWTLTMQCIKFVLLPLKVTVQIRGLSKWQQSQALPTTSAGTPVDQAVWGFSSSNARLGKSLAKKMYIFAKNLNMKCILIYATPLCWWCHSASLLQVGVGLTLMVATPSRRSSAVAPSVAEAMEAGFLPPLDEDQAYMLLVPRRSCACTDTLRTTVY